MHKYRLISKKGEGTFSEVLKAQSIKNNKYLAIKCMKSHFESIDQVNNLREIQALRRLSPHPGIIKLYEVLYDQPTGRLALVFELMDMNVYELIRNRKEYLPESRVKNYMYQLVKSMDHMHRNGIFHRDIKPENILVANDVLKVADFGSCRGIYSKPPYTEYISTRWYRAPECLLTDGYYGYKMDMWGVGCVMFEVIALFPLFPGTNELDQIERIHNIVGTPPKEILEKFKKYATHIDFNFTEKAGSGIAKLIPHADATCVDLIVKLLAYDPEDRLSARQALRHPYFSELRQAEKRAEREKAAALKSSQHQQQSPQAKGFTVEHMESRPAKRKVHNKPHGGGKSESLSVDSKSAVAELEELEFTTKAERKKKNKDIMSSSLPSISPIKNPQKSNKGDSVALPSINASPLKQQHKGKSKAPKDARDPFAHKKAKQQQHKYGVHQNKHMNNPVSDESDAEDRFSYLSSKANKPIVGSGVRKKGAKKYLSPTHKGSSAMYGRKVGNRMYFESHNASATSPNKTYKSSYQSPYSQKYIARQRHLA